ncbi:MAG: hypothetical protein AABX51_02945 [Nanoarchaeota archaeon]
MKVIIIILTMLLLIGCTQQITKKQEQRINILYEHTKLMIQASTAQQLDKIGVNAKDFVPAVTSIQKLVILERTMRLQGTGDAESRISNAESAMNQLMIRWSKLDDLK